MADKLKLNTGIIAIVCLGTFMSALDSSIVNISLPSISNYFNIDLAAVEWVVLSYLIVISSLLLTYGRLGDIFGHKIIYLIGFVIFTIGSILCALSPEIIFLILSRAVQAVGAGMLMSMGPAIITANSKQENRGRSLGFIAISVSVALAAGPAAGGFLTSFFGWKSIFMINIPIGIGSFIWALKILPDKIEKRKQAFDYIGSIIFFIALVAIILPLNFAEKLGWDSPYIIGSLTIGGFLFVLFFIAEKKIKNPMLDLSLFKSRVFAAGNLALLFNFISQFTIILIMPFYLIELKNFSPLIAGLILIANPLMVMLITPLSGYLSDKSDARYVSSLGMFIISIGFFLLSTLGINSRIILIILYAGLCGLGSGLFQTPNNSAIMGSVTNDKRGTASAMIATMRNLGMVLGVAFSGAIFSSRQNYLNEFLSSQGLLNPELFIKSFSGALKITFISAAFLAAFAAIVSLTRGPLNKKISSENH